MRINEVKEKCTGCGACIVTCPTNAIQMIEDEEGFEIPVINEEKCINCGKCHNFCHINKNEAKNSKIQKAYYGRAKNEEVVKLSSSGGMYYPIANYLASKGYICYGAVWDDKEKHVKHASNIEYPLKEQMGSKYVQSTTWESFDEIKKQLENGKKILFSGTPCQVAGLKKLVGENENLVTIDIICHGVPSHKILYERMKELEDKHKANITRIKFRSKIGKWSEHKLYVEFDNKDIELIPYTHDTYFKLFLGNSILRKSCYDCNYSNSQHEADLTIADFWKLLTYSPKENDEKGTSIILVNTKKGEEILEQVKEQFNFKELDWEVAKYVYKTHNNYKKEKREQFFNTYKDSGFEAAVNKIKTKKSLYGIYKSIITGVKYKKISKKLTQENKM